MEPTSRKAADRVNKHREDGEEAIKRSSNVVPIDAGKGKESVQVTPDSESQSEENQPRQRGRE
jgi:hypothetical protein